ncbi:hypothetical protein CF326_g4445 [Tilletia indica]|nr:hypothetical protein CF326_g4445 [Tilletia indica]
MRASPCHRSGIGRTRGWSKVLCNTSTPGAVSGVPCITPCPRTLLHFGVCAPQDGGTPFSTEYLTARLASRGESGANALKPRRRRTGKAPVPEHLGETIEVIGGREGGTGILGGKEKEGGAREDELVTDAQRALAHERAVIRWHQRLAHLSFRSLAKLIGLGVEGLKHLNKGAALRLVDQEDRCDACAIANLKKASYGASDSRAEDRADLVNCDLSGPYTGNQEYAYSLSMQDDHSRKGWSHPIPDKSSATVTEVLQRWYRQVATFTGRKVVTLHTDNGTEFDNVAMDAWAAKEGISWRWTVPGSSEQNGRVERLQGLIQERGRAMLTAARLPLGFWPFAWRYAAYLINRTPHRSLDYRIPQEIWSKRPVDLTALRTFGCLCWTMQDARHRPDGKLSARGVRGTFLGISEDRKGWLIYVPSDTTNPLRYSRSVLFDETRTYDEGRSLDILQRHTARTDDKVEMVLPFPRRRRRKAVEGEDETLKVPYDLRDDDLGGLTRNGDVIISTLPVPDTQTLDRTEETPDQTAKERVDVMEHEGVPKTEEMAEQEGVESEQWDEVVGQRVEQGRIEEIQMTEEVADQEGVEPGRWDQEMGRSVMQGHVDGVVGPDGVTREKSVEEKGLRDSRKGGRKEGVESEQWDEVVGQRVEQGRIEEIQMTEEVADQEGVEPGRWDQEMGRSVMQGHVDGVVGPDGVTREKSVEEKGLRDSRKGGRKEKGAAPTRKSHRIDYPRPDP